MKRRLFLALLLASSTGLAMAADDAVSQQVVRLLIEGGADVNIADREGVTPLTHARQRGFGEIARLLEAAGAH